MPAQSEKTKSGVKTAAKKASKTWSGGVPRTMSVFVRIEILGGFRLTVAGRVVTSLPQKAKALLAYLAMQDGRPVTRETAADLLWTDRGATQARNSLRETLRVIRRDVGEMISPGQRVLTFVPGTVDSDIDRFRLLSRSSERADLVEAAELYRGELLEGLTGAALDFDDWLRLARGEVTALAIDTYRRIVDTCLAVGDLHPAVVAAERMLGLDPLREDNHRTLMEVYLRAGRRADAIRQYKDCVEVLKRELDVAPSVETEALWRNLQDTDGNIDSSHTRTVVTTIGYGPPRYDGPPRLAVLSFAQIGSEIVPSHVRDGLIADVIYQLSGLRELAVIGHGSSSRYLSGHADIQEVERVLGVNYVLSGSLRRSAQRLRLVSELIDVRNQSVIWARTHDTDIAVSFEN